MNREIKFRVWDNNNKGFVKNSFVGAMPLFMLNLDFEFGFIKDSWDGQLPPDYIFQQFTGLKDKKGKEIFEGDLFNFIIIGFSASINCGVIEFINGKFTIHIQNIKKEYMNFEYIDLGNYAISGEIIGNTFENLELLEK